jgi:hypothetical protein
MNWTLISIFVVVSTLFSLLLYINNRWLIPWHAQRTVDKLLKDIKNGKPQKPREYNLEISFDSKGFWVQSLKNPAEMTDKIPWSQITHVTAFKRDLLTTDCVCLLFAMSDEKGIELDEEMKGWTELLEAMPNYLPGCKQMSEWLFSVTSPAFAINATEIYSRAA